MRHRNYTANNTPIMNSERRGKPVRPLWRNARRSERVVFGNRLLSRVILSRIIISSVHPFYYYFPPPPPPEYLRPNVSAVDFAIGRPRTDTPKQNERSGIRPKGKYALDFATIVRAVSTRPFTTRARARTHTRTEFDNKNALWTARVMSSCVRVHTVIIIRRSVRTEHSDNLANQNDEISDD